MIMKFRKDFLAGYLVKLVSMDYEKRQSWEYLDKAGLMHTGTPGWVLTSVKFSFFFGVLISFSDSCLSSWNEPYLRVEYSLRYSPWSRQLNAVLTLPTPRPP